MIRHTLKTLQQMLQDFQCVSDHFGTLCIKWLKVILEKVLKMFVLKARLYVFFLFHDSPYCVRSLSVK